jgi:tRNA (guanine37-N1)-methyltransferase
MTFEILTLFPGFFESPLRTSLLGRAIAAGVVSVTVTDVRDFAAGRHRVADDTPYGGGSGMVMKIEPVVAALEAARERSPRAWRVHLTPGGRPLDQARVAALAGEHGLVLLCGHYEGIDDRVAEWIDEEISLGDFVLAGGESAALVLLEAVARLRPGFVGNESSLAEESFAEGLLEYPQYTRPEDFRGRCVPAPLLSGNHAAIARWRRKEALRRTRTRRPDLLARARLDRADRALLEELDREDEGA